MYVCMYVCNVCKYVCMHVCMHACMYVCMHACMYVCIYVCMYVCCKSSEVHVCAVAEAVAMKEQCKVMTMATQKGVPSRGVTDCV
jgi:hypothetical protein